MKRKNTELIIKIAILGALSAIIMTFSFPLPFVPPFYRLDLSEVIVLLAGFSLGPIPAIAVEAVKIVINFLLNGTTTMGIGEFSNFIMGCAFVLPASILYKKRRDLKFVFLGLLLSSFSLAILSVALNYFILLPVYAYFFQMPIDSLIEMGTSLNSNINSLFSFVLLATLPFNLIKGFINAVVILISYKKISPIIKAKT